MRVIQECSSLICGIECVEEGVALGYRKLVAINNDGIVSIFQRYLVQKADGPPF